eukprot:TRINITY_DN11531_c0_g1_i1.p1 TRINITY_DN11531_c0_g1~~TRINITY_DN11531_c0_g1_i1.p1  ORF type:complete len:186 (-),score=28.44 TRINITY_DN11531_c0_g1_i1:246-803(-)
MENTESGNIAVGTVESMDRFLASNPDVTLQNLQRMEDKEGEPGVKVCYLEPNDVGPFRSQMRLTVRVSFPQSGTCDVDIMNMENGTVNKKTGEATFPDPSEVDYKFKFDTSNILIWEKTANGGLQLRNTSRNRSELTLPTWFPLPDALISTVTKAFVVGIVKNGQKAVVEQISKQYKTWLVKNSA